MGCFSSKEIESNLETNDVRGRRPSNRVPIVSSPPSQIIGSTQLRADQIVVLGDSVFLPTKDPETGESAILDIEVADKKMRVYRGYKNRLVRNGVS